MKLDRKNTWSIGLQVPKGQNGLLLDCECLQLMRLNEGLRAKIQTRWMAQTERFGKDPVLSFELTSDRHAGYVELVWRHYSFELYVDGQLEDQEWPLGDLYGKNDVWVSDSVTDVMYTDANREPDHSEEFYNKPFQYLQCPHNHAGIGDCMPFNRDGQYCLYYLLDRHGHKSKKGLGAHQWAQISSHDLKHWTVHPIAIGITHQWEGSICTGSLIEKDKEVWAFYAVRMADGSPAQITWAVSKDGIHFEKSNECISLAHPYEPVSARDPHVFWGADGQYHMLVTTSLIGNEPYGGCLAHLTSDNLVNWVQREPFIVPGLSGQPECSDYFEWNGWYYLVFSNCAIAHYRISRSPFGPWIRPETDLLDALEVQVPKTALYKNRRFSTGFLARYPRTYAGNAVTHELFQRDDGTLGVMQAEELLPKEIQRQEYPNVRLEMRSGRSSWGPDETKSAVRLRATLCFDNAASVIGITLSSPEDGIYRMELDCPSKTFQIIRPREDFNCGSGRDLLKNIKITNGTIGIDLIICEDIMDIVFTNGQAITMRLNKEAKKKKIDFYVIDGLLEVKDIRMGILE